MIADPGGGTPPRRYAAPYSHPNANNSRPSYGSSGGGYTGNNGGYNTPGPNQSQRYYGQTTVTRPNYAQIRAAQQRAAAGQSAAADARTAAAYAKSLQYNKNWPDQF